MPSTLWLCQQLAIEAMAIEIVDFPIENGGSFNSYVKLPEGKLQSCWKAIKFGIQCLGDATNEQFGNVTPIKSPKTNQRLCQIDYIKSNLVGGFNHLEK